VSASGSAPAAPRVPITLVAAGGAVGSGLRYQLGQWFPTAAGTFPATTFAINVAGAFALGVLYAWLARRAQEDSWRRALIGIGFMGAFTTFSTLCVDAVLLVRGDDVALAAAYVLASVAAGLVAAAAGIRMAGGRLAAALPSGES
jgi:CrcB protein